MITRPVSGKGDATMTTGTTTTGTTTQTARATGTVPVLPLWIAGREHEGTSGRFSEVTDPATGR